MKETIAKINVNILEKLALTVFGLLAGIILTELLKDTYIDYFLLCLIFILAFLYIYYKHSCHVENISTVLSDIYYNQKGDIKYFDSPKEFYKESSSYMLNAENEVLIYNDYFGQDSAPMGFDTSDKYYLSLEDKLKKNNNLKLSCIISASDLRESILSERYQEHLNILFSILQNRDDNSGITPFAFADKNKRPLYFSFTIIDNNILRIPLRGIVDTQEEKKFRPSKIVGGLIIKNNEEIITHFRNKFKNTEQIATKFISVDEILDAIN